MNWENQYDRTILEGDLGDFTDPVLIYKVDETKWEALWDHLVKTYHYLGFESTIGGRVKYLVTLGKKLVGAISFCSAVYHLGPRDQFVGWDEGTRVKYLPHLLNNNRFLILPWIKVRNLASHILALSLKRIRVDWKKQYEVEPYMVETFVDRQKYHGTSYKAANWTYLGVTKGFGKLGKGFVYHGNEKDLYVYVMNHRFRRIFKPDTGRLTDTRKDLLRMINGIPLFFPDILEKLGVTDLTCENFDNLLLEHLERYLRYLNRKELKPHMVATIKGHLSNLERKSNEPIALAFEGACEVRNLANFMTRSPFDHEGMLEEYQKEVCGILSHPEGMITGDGCDFPKKGKYSVGVARQYCGRLGKVDNCQASVMVGYTSPNGYGLLDYTLYMPKKWFSDEYAELRLKCQVPKDLEFKTKNQLLLDLITKAFNSGKLEAKYVGVDSSFGKDHTFLDSLPKGLIYFADIPSNHLVFVGRPEMVVPEYCGRGRMPVATPSFPPLRVRDIAADPSFPWEDVVLGMGAKGPIIAKDKCLKVVEVRDGNPGSDVWLYLRQLEDGSIKYALCNESMEATKEAVRKPALMRWTIEQSFKECKEHLGMDHYEVRIWQAWRRHILFTFISHLFIIKLRRLFSIKMDTPGPAPIIEVPVPLEDYRDAIVQVQSNQSISHPNIRAIPKAPQQIMTIGLVRKLIEPFLIKVGEVHDRIEHSLRSSYSAFISYNKAKVAMVMGERVLEGDRVEDVFFESTL